MLVLVGGKVNVRQRGDTHFLASVQDLADGQVLFVRPPGLTAHVDQTQAPSGPSFAGRPWDNIGTITVGPDSPDIQVVVKQATAGVVAVDSVRLVKVDQMLPPEKIALAIAALDKSSDQSASAKP